MSYELRNRPRSLPSHYGSVVEHWSAESEGLRFDSSLGLAIFSLSHTHDIMEKKIFLHLQTRHLLLHHYIMWMNEWQSLHHSQSKVVCLNFLQLWLLKH